MVASGLRPKRLLEFALYVNRICVRFEHLPVRAFVRLVRFVFFVFFVQFVRFVRVMWFARYMQVFDGSSVLHPQLLVPP